MSKLTLGRMAKLYGLHRSTLYEAVSKGRVSAGVDGKGQRVIDLSEMIRVYGEPPGGRPSASDTPTPAPDSNPTPANWAELTAELRLLREEVAGLRQELRLLEHRPDRSATESADPQAEDEPPVGDGLQEPEEAPRARSFADVLASFS